MSLILTKRDDNSRYKVNVVTKDDKNVNSLSKAPSKKVRSLRVTISRMISIILIALFGSLGFLGTIATAAPAQADPLGIKDAFCSTSIYNYGLNTRFLGPTTGDETSATATPYEKYGTAGLTWTVWHGPEKQEQLDDDGDFSGKQIVEFSGNSDEIGTWGDKPEGDETLFGFYNQNEACAPFVNVGTTFMGNFLLQGSAEVIHITNLVYQMAYETSSNILKSIEPIVEKIVESLKDAIYLEFITPVIMIAALWMAWVGLVKKQSTEMAQGAIWMIGAMVASIALMTHPMWLPDKVNAVVGSVSEASMDAITSATADENGESMCAATTQVAPTIPDNPDTAVNEAKETDPDTRNSIRRTQCTLWYSFLYTPWVIGEFGESPTEIASNEKSLALNGWATATSTDGPVAVNGNTLMETVKPVTFANVPAPAGSQNWALYHLDNKVRYDSDTNEQVYQKQRALLDVANTQLHMENYNKAYKGEDSMNRVATAGLSLLAALGAALMIIIISMSIIILDIGLIVMTLISPLFFLIGVHPGVGRRIALGWMETIIGLALKRIVLSVFLAVMLVFYTAVLDEGSNLPWLLSMVMVVAVSIAGVTYRDQVVGMVNKVSLGGNGGLSQQNLPGQNKASNEMKKLGKTAALHAVGLDHGSRAGRSMAKRMGGGGDNRGAGAEKNGSDKPSIKDQAAQDVLNGGGAGPSKNTPIDDSSDARSGGEAGTAGAVGSTAGAGATPIAGGPNSGSNGKAFNPEEDEKGSTDGAGMPVNGSEGNPEVDASGAGPAPQRYMNAQGSIVNADGSVVPDSELSAEERDAAKALNGGAGEAPSTAAERLRASSPKAIEQAAQERAKQQKLLPPLPIPANAQTQAARYNKKVDSEKARLQKKVEKEASSTGAIPATVSRTEAMNSLKKREDQAQQARKARTDKLSKIKREVLQEPLKELRDGAKGAEKMLGNPVERSVKKVSGAAGKAAQTVETRANKHLEQREAKKQFEDKVANRVKEIKQETRSAQRQLREELKSIPKSHQKAFIEKWNKENGK